MDLILKTSQSYTAYRGQTGENHRKMLYREQVMTMIIS